MESNTRPIDTINLGELIKDFQVVDVPSFGNYLRDIWGDLAQRSKEPQKGVEKVTFNKYYNLPGILAERLFSVIDKNKDGFIDYTEFYEGMKTLFCQGISFNTLAKFIFKFYDFEKHGVITREDVRVVLSYCPLQTGSAWANQQDFKDRVESQDQLFNILNTAFGTKNEMNLDEYINVVENINSDIFIFILMFLLEKRPFSKESCQVFATATSESTSPNVCKTPKLLAKNIASPSMTSKFVSPTLKKRTIAQNSKFGRGGASGAGGGGNILNMYSGMGKTDNSAKVVVEEKSDEQKGNGSPHKVQRRYRINLEHLADKTPAISNFKFNPEEKEEFDNGEEEKKNDNVIRYEGTIYKMSDKKKIKQVYFVLIGKDFYYYKKKGDKEHKGMHNLSGIFVKKSDDYTNEDGKFYTIALVFPQKTRLYYFKSEEDRNTWLEKLQLAIDHKSILDEYEIKKRIGKGKFGLVKRGENKKTHQKVAIKIMSKKDMDKSDLELAKVEVDILKICQHPNIIRLYDEFESPDYIYIVMEYCGGGDLLSYIEKTDYRLPEPRACEIIHKLSMAIYYIHSYGVIHRDLKPENILMTDSSENADIRLLDFGLSKIIGPDEKCTEPYGTLAFVAPEVLLGKPYDKSVDLWSIGVTTYLLLAGSLPFDDKHSEREIARKTIHDDVKFEKVWDDISKEARKFVESLLKKNPAERLTIKEVLEHPWIKKYSKVPASRINNSLMDGNKFSAYASVK